MLAADLFSVKRETETTGMASDSECSKDRKETLENVFKFLWRRVYFSKQDEYLFV